MKKSVIAYHFVGDTLRDGSPIPPIGKRLKICETGLHASRHPYDALQYAPGPNLCLVRCSGIADEQDDKLVCRSRTILKRFDATTMLRAYARWCALQVAHLWDASEIVVGYLKTGDESKRAAARDAARNARDAAQSATWAATWAAARDAAWNARDAAQSATWAATWAAARDAAWAARDAAQSATWAATWAAARDAAWAATWAAQKTEFQRLVDAEFAKIQRKE